MDFDLGTRYQRPADEPESWFHDVLEQVRSERDGAVRIQIDAVGGRHQVVGFLESADERLPGKVRITSHGEELVIASEKIEAFTLLPDSATD
jgi:hypothetical protein